MTVSSTTVKNSFSGDGSTTQFTYTFPINTTAELKVIERSSLGAETVKTLNSDYTVVDNGSSGGTVTFTSAPASGASIVLLRDTNLTQDTDYVANDPFPAESHETALDKLTLQQQEIQEEIDRSLKLSRTNTMTSTEFTIDASSRANKVLGFDSAGELSVTTTIGSNRGNWASGTAYSVRDIVKDTSTNNIFMVNSAHSSSGAEPLTTNTNSTKYDLLVDAAASTTAQNAATSSATAAATSETNSAASAASALSHKNDAETAKTASETAETAAETARTAAQTAQAAAETALDNFDDIYLGAKASDPALDNDGDALTAGDLYFNTTVNQLKYYNGSSWSGIGVNTDETVKVSSNDTSNGYLNGKLVAGTGIALIENSDGGNETLTIKTDNPTITSISPDTITNAATNIVITGTNYVITPIVEFINTTGGVTLANSVTRDSATQLTVNITLPTDGTYFIRIENPDGLAVRSSTALLTVSDAPTWTTAAGSLGSVAGGSSVSLSVAGTSDSTVAYSETTAVLTSNTDTPNSTMNLSLNSSTGAITGTAPEPTAEKVYNFTLRLTDAESQTTDRAFSITVTSEINNGGQFN